MINRLKEILNYYNLTPSMFADKIGVQRSSMTHIFSGRNKPSLDFITKLINKFPNINLYWLINGEGVFLKNRDENLNASIQDSLFRDSALEEEIETTEDPPQKIDIPIRQPEHIEKQSFIPQEEKIIPEKNNLKEEKKVSRIVMFYDDGTFDSFNSN